MTGVARTGAVLLIALLVAIGCAGPGPEPTGKPTTGSGGAFPRTVMHVMGSTEIPAEPTRIMALDQTFVDAALALDMAVVGFTDIRGTGGEPPPYLATPMARLAPDARSVGELASPSLEQVAALKPDLIVSAKIRHEAIYDKLSRIAPTVFTETTGATWKDNLRLLAKAIGKEDLARTRLAEYEQRARTIGDAIRAAEGKNPTITVIRFSDMQTRLYQRASFSGIVLADTGLARPPSQDVDKFAVEFSAERILDADADHLFLTVAEGDSAPVRDRFTSKWGGQTWQEATFSFAYAPGKIVTLKSDEDLGLFQNLRGVRDGRYIVIDLPTATALRSPSVLSIRWGLDHIRPSLARVAGS